jgi:serine/threonine protein phosphatase PrpC
MRQSGGFSRPFRGLTVCGDSFLVEEWDGTLVAAVADGLGHGAESALAAERAVAVVREHAALPVGDILLRCHQELRATRGAAVALLKLAAGGQGEFCGVGNVEVQALAGGAPGLFCRAGIVGHNLRECRVMPFTMRGGDVYCLCSDGISSRADLRSCLPGPPQSVARCIVERWGKAHDDATAVVIGYDAGALLGREEVQLLPTERKTS